MNPKLIAFDLDYTLWPFWVDTHVTPPFHKEKLSRVARFFARFARTNFEDYNKINGVVYDYCLKEVRYYKEVPQVLEYLYNKGYILAVASRTGELEGANQLLKLFDWDKYFNYKEIYPGCKITHFKRIKSKSGLEFNEMLFFDDEKRNKIDLQKIGVLTIMVTNGVTKKLVDSGIQEFSRTRSCT